MLNAILSGKAGTIETQPGTNVAWKTLYRAREDLFTSTIIERLTYLPSSLLFRLFRVASVSDVLPVSLGQLLNVDFWPSFTRPDSDKSTVEPDAVLTFERGTLIIEAKASDQLMQSADQWAKEWASYHFALAAGESPEIDRMSVYFLALGGLGENTLDTTVRITAEAQELLNIRWPAISPRLMATGCSWLGLATVVRHERDARKAIWDESGLTILLKDLDEAFTLHEVRRKRWLDELAQRPFAQLDDCLPFVAFRSDGNHQRSDVSREWHSLARLTPISSDEATLRRLRDA